jgi:hypothetical protein
MSLLIFAIIVLIVAALLAYAVGYLPLAAPFNRLVQALILVVAALLIASRAGVF